MKKEFMYIYKARFGKNKKKKMNGSWKRAIQKKRRVKTRRKKSSEVEKTLFLNGNLRKWVSGAVGSFKNFKK